jgi:hypothetical protein
VQISTTITEVIQHFNCAADPSSYRPYGSGHINDTFLLENVDKDGPDYLLQRINHGIFTNVEKLMENMQRVTMHLRDKLVVQGGDPTKEVMTLIPTLDDQYYYQDSNGDYWRMMYFMKDTRSYDLVTTEKQAYEGGKAFGKFQAMLSDLPSDQMYEVIPNFHNIQVRLGHLEAAVADDPLGRSKEVAAELELVRAHADAMLYFQQAALVAVLPKRVIHNDTKFNNVLLNENDEAQCVIDLETVMEGYVAYDFGDAIRSIINTSTEDEPDLNKIQLNMPLFNAYTRGYLEYAGQFITVDEVQSLVKGVLLLPFMQAVRFLTDHINGDTYFKIKFPGHNLQRARAQFQLFLKLNAQAETMNTTIMEEISKSYLS